MLDIKFKVGQKKYELTSTFYDFMLWEVNTIKSGDNIGNETTKRIGCFSTIKNVLNYIPDHHLRNIECSTLSDLNNEVKLMMKDLCEITKDLIAESYLSEVDIKSKNDKVNKLIESRKK